MTSHSTKPLVYIAIGTAIIAALSQISLSIGPVPFTLQTLGAIGLPVFAGFSGGFAALVGPTAGFLWGFLIYAVFTSSLTKSFLTSDRFSRLPTRNRVLLTYRFVGL